MGRAIAIFEGREWVDATVAYPQLPQELQISDHKWDRRLRALGIKPVLPDVRSTEKGNIRCEISSGRAQKSKYVVKSLWDAKVLAAQERLEDTDSSQHIHEAPINDAPDDAPDDGPSLTLPSIEFAESERFVHDGQQLRIRAYGERTVKGLFLDARDVSDAIGVRFDHNPDQVAIGVAHVIGQEVPVPTLTWENFILLVFLKARCHPAAAGIKDWVTNTVFAVQFEGGAGTTQQAAYASRNVRYSCATYTADLRQDDKIIYVFDAFPACALEEKYPGCVAPLVDRTDSLIGYRVIKIGIGRRDRIQVTRNELNKILPGHDPRPIIVLKVHGVSDTELKNNFESPVFDEFPDFRIGHGGKPSIPGPRNGQYTELVVADPDTKEQVVRRIVNMVDNHHENLRAHTTAALRAAEKAMDQVDLKDARIAHLEAALNAREDECTRLETTMAQILPRKMSCLRSMLSRVQS